MAGRKCKLTDELTDIICENIELGLSYNLTCQAAGISFDTFNNWMKAGEAEESKKFSDFYDRVRASEAACAKESLERIRDAANTNWNAAAWLLERRYPADYGKKDHLNMQSKTENLNVNAQLSDDEIETRRSALLSRILGELTAE
jgi:hypothetical protein